MHAIAYATWVELGQSLRTRPAYAVYYRSQTTRSQGISRASPPLGEIFLSGNHAGGHVDVIGARKGPWKSRSLTKEDG